MDPRPSHRNSLSRITASAPDLGMTPRLREASPRRFSLALGGREEQSGANSCPCSKETTVQATSGVATPARRVRVINYS